MLFAHRLIKQDRINCTGSASFSKRESFSQTRARDYGYSVDEKARNRKRWEAFYFYHNKVDIARLNEINEERNRLFEVIAQKNAMPHQVKRYASLNAEKLEIEEKLERFKEIHKGKKNG